MTNTEATEIITVKRGNGAKIHRGLTVSGRLVTYCATDTNAAGSNGLRVRKIVGTVDCKACAKSLN
jgi:hypothetical protein